jgi:hypothetical protein
MLRKMGVGLVVGTDYIVVYDDKQSTDMLQSLFTLPHVIPMTRSMLQCLKKAPSKRNCCGVRKVTWLQEIISGQSKCSGECSEHGLIRH